MTASATPPAEPPLGRPLRLIFAGTPEFAAEALAQLHQAGHDVVLVLSQPDRPAGRGMKLQASPVKQFALSHGVPVAQPRSLRLDGKYPMDAQAAALALKEADADAMVVAAYGLILPQWVLDVPRLGCFNIHASLLPRWRGAAPIHRAIEAGDAQTGITIMQMDEGLDTGDMLLVESLPIDPSDTGSSLHDKLASLGADMIVRALKALDAAEDTGNTLKATPQPVEGVTYAAKLDRAQAALDPHSPAAVLARRVRAFNPVPGATITLPGLPEPVKIWQAQAIPTSVQSAPGTVLRATADGIDIATADGTLRLLELQRAGGKRQPAAIFIQGWSAPV